jgi:hypothetical protein
MDDKKKERTDKVEKDLEQPFRKRSDERKKLFDIPPPPDDDGK